MSLQASQLHQPLLEHAEDELDGTSSDASSRRSNSSDSPASITRELTEVGRVAVEKPNEISNKEILGTTPIAPTVIIGEAVDFNPLEEESPKPRRKNKTTISHQRPKNTGSGQPKNKRENFTWTGIQGVYVYIYKL